jgi:hypothetical protein
MAWEWRENNREKVLTALRTGEYEAILASREGALDALAQLAWELDTLSAVSLIEIDRERGGSRMTCCSAHWPCCRLWKH